MNLHHFYHIYADGNWQQPVIEHIRALKEYGLYEALSTFKIGFVGSKYNVVQVISYLADQGVLFEMCDNKQTGWEQVTQIPMWEFSQKRDGLILYAHSKGASNTNEVNTRWRRSMTYWNVIRWKDCIEKLKDHDAVGNHWIQPLLEGMPEHKPGNYMFAGTFFWTKCEVMREFPKPALTHRHEAEGFIGYGWHQKPFPVYDFTPYFPNSDTFYDHWLVNPNNHPIDNGKSYRV